MPTRIIHHGDGIAWIARAQLSPDHAVVTSLPDVSEYPGHDVTRWRAWFIETAALLCRQTSDEAVTIFFQTDIKLEGRWIDKGYLIERGAEEAGSHLLFHKIVCRAPVGTTTFGRPAYAHLMCFSRTRRLDTAHSSADVIERLGAMPWARAMGVGACEATCRFLLANTACRTVVDPFCGLGTMLAVANAYDMNAIGVELSARRARRAEKLIVNVERVVP